MSKAKPLTTTQLSEIAEAWKSGQPWNARISHMGRCGECAHRTVFDPGGAAVLFHDAGCGQHAPCPTHHASCKGTDHHSPSERTGCQHCMQIMIDRCKPPAAQSSDTALLVGDRVLYWYGRGEGGVQTWGYISCIRWNDYTKEVWIHTREHPNLVLQEGDIIEVDLHMRDARSAQWK